MELYFRAAGGIVWNGLLFVAEIIFGMRTHSICLLVHGLHTLYKAVEEVLILICAKIPQTGTTKNTFGWARSHLLGVTVNSVFLAALCFSMFVSSLKRLVVAEHLHDHLSIVILGAVGVLSGLVSLAMAQIYRSCIGGKDTEKIQPKSDATLSEMEIFIKRRGQLDNNPVIDIRWTLTSIGGAIVILVDGLIQVFLRQDGELPPTCAPDTLAPPIVPLGNITYAANATTYAANATSLPCPDSGAKWPDYVDAVSSMIMIVIIFGGTLPKFKNACMVLMQAAPGHIEVTELAEKMKKSVPGIDSIHEFHLWQLTGRHVVATVHVKLRDLTEFPRLAENVEDFLMREGVHSVTVQPEIYKTPLGSSSSEERLTESMNRCCELDCGPACFKKKCCKPCVERHTCNS